MYNAALEKRRALHIYSEFAITHEAPDVANNITYSAAELITLHCFIFNLVFLSLLLAPLANAGETRYEILKKTYENRLNDADIHIVGKITDIDNNELENVFLEIEFIRPKNVWATESERLCDSRKVNGKFLLQKKNYTAVSITFNELPRGRAREVSCLRKVIFQNQTLVVAQKFSRIFLDLQHNFEF